MATGAQVLTKLIPNGGWYIAGNDYEGIQFLNCEPISKKDYEAAFAQYDALKAEEDAAQAEAKAALLDRLGITAEEAKLLLS